MKKIIKLLLISCNSLTVSTLVTGCDFSFNDDTSNNDINPPPDPPSPPDPNPDKTQIEKYQDEIKENKRLISELNKKIAETETERDNTTDQKEKDELDSFINFSKALKDQDYATIYDDGYQILLLKTNGILDCKQRKKAKNFLQQEIHVLTDENHIKDMEPKIIKQNKKKINELKKLINKLIIIQKESEW